MEQDAPKALLVALPREDLRSAGGLLQERDNVVLPAGGPGELDEVPAGTTVLLMASDPSGDQVPAATWRAELVGRVPHEIGETYPDGLPPSWLERHPFTGPHPQLTLGGTSEIAPEDDDDDDDERDEAPGPQSFFEVTGLRELPKQEWLFVNELVGKQARRGRTFFPRVPIAVRLPD